MSRWAGTRSDDVCTQMFVNELSRSGTWSEFFDPPARDSSSPRQPLAPAMATHKSESSLVSLYGYKYLNQVLLIYYCSNINQDGPSVYFNQHQRIYEVPHQSFIYIAICVPRRNLNLSPDSVAIGTRDSTLSRDYRKISLRYVCNMLAKLTREVEVRDGVYYTSHDTKNLIKVEPILWHKLL